MFLMPSRYEPCGLNQIYSLKYGTVPIVRATGGLDDTIEPWDARSGKGTGFKFTEYNGESLLLTMKAALQAFRDQTSWQALMRNGMSKDFSWTASAREYVKVYEKVRQLRIAAHTHRKSNGVEVCRDGPPRPSPERSEVVCPGAARICLAWQRCTSPSFPAPSSTSTWTLSSSRWKNCTTRR